MKSFVICGFALAVFACNTSPSNQMQKNDTNAATDSVIDNAGLTGDTEYIKGARLIAANDCLGCHKINAKATGPSYRSVAAKYQFNEGNVENLAHKIIIGGKGIWGNEVAMPPHSNIEPNDAAEMVKYILSLRTAKQ